MHKHCENSLRHQPTAAPLAVPQTLVCLMTPLAATFASGVSIPWCSVRQMVHVAALLAVLPRGSMIARIAPKAATARGAG